MYVVVGLIGALLCHIKVYHVIITEINTVSFLVSYIHPVVRKRQAMAFSLTPRQLLQAKEAIEMLSNLSGENRGKNRGENASSSRQVVQSAPASQPIQQSTDTCTRKSEASDGMHLQFEFYSHKTV